MLSVVRGRRQRSNGRPWADGLGRATGGGKWPGVGLGVSGVGGQTRRRGRVGREWGSGDKDLAEGVR